MKGKLVFKIQTRPQQRSVRSPAKMSKVLDFLADNDHDELDSNGATLEAGPLPESTSPPMTISSLTALLSTPAQPWKLVLSLSPLALQSWLRLGPLSFPKLCGSNCLIMRGSHATPSYTEYSVHFGQVFFFDQTGNVFFPLQWTHVCLSPDSVTSKVTPVVDRQVLGEEDEFRVQAGQYKFGSWV